LIFFLSSFLVANIIRDIDGIENAHEKFDVRVVRRLTRLNAHTAYNVLCKYRSEETAENLCAATLQNDTG
jgi:hypothetical protein